MNEYLKKRNEMKTFGKSPEPKKQYTIPKKSAKKIEQEKKEKEERGDNDTEKQKWFRNRIKFMTGYCAETGLKTETKIYRYAINSICHLLSQQHCPSVMYHPLNWIELNQDFHVKFDKMSWEEREKLGCWPIIQQRLVGVYPDLDPNERRHFPESVLKYMNRNDVF